MEPAAMAKIRAASWWGNRNTPCSGWFLSVLRCSKAQRIDGFDQE